MSELKAQKVVQELIIQDKDDVGLYQQGNNGNGEKETDLFEVELTSLSSRLGAEDGGKVKNAEVSGLTNEVTRGIIDRADKEWKWSSLGVQV